MGVIGAKAFNVTPPDGLEDSTVKIVTFVSLGADLPLLNLRRPG